jgi:PAS domain S-box-containing protein
MDKHSNTFNVQNYGLLELNLQGEIIAVNDYFSLLLGYEISDLSKIQSFQNLLVDFPEAESFDIQQLSNLGAIALLFKHKSGNLIQLQAEICTKYNLENNLIGYTVIFNECKDEQDFLMNYHNQLIINTLYKSTVQLIFIANLDWQFVWVNEKARSFVFEQFGQYPLIGENILDYCLDYHLEAFKIIYTKVIAGESQSYETKIDYPNGKEVWFQIKTLPVFNAQNEIIGAIFNGLDITEKKKNESIIKQKEVQLRALFDSSAQFITLMDLDGRILWLNKATKENILQNYRFNVEVGNNIRLLVLPDTKEGFEASFEKAKQGQSITVERQIKYPKSSNQRRWMSFNYNPVTNDHGEIIGVSITSIDITDKKNFELALIQAKQNAEEFAKYKEAFLNSISHELRTPLNAILGISELLGGLTDQIKAEEYVKILQFSSRQLLKVINDTLDYHKIEANKFILEYLPFNLKDLIQNLHKSFMVSSKMLNVNMQFDIDSKIPDLVIGDSFRLTQVLTNLISNAIKFTPKDGQINIQLQALNSKKKEVNILFSIQDTGIGISSNQLKVIFEPFNQASVEIARKFGGSGLGLSLTKELLRLMNSQLKVESELNKGSRFFFEINFGCENSNKKGGKRNAKTSKNALNPTNTQYKFLLVDDSTINQFVAKEFLEKEGFFCETVENSKDAIAKVKSKIYDLILMDIQLPDRDGLETISLIRKMSESYFKQIPIIILSADNELNSKTRAQNLGANDYLTKPYLPPVLLSKIRAQLDLSKVQKTQEKTLVQSIKENISEDEKFKVEFYNLCLIALKEIKQVCSDAQVTKKYASLSVLLHKNKVTFQILDTDQLGQLIQNLMSNLKNTPEKDNEQIKYIAQINKWCDKLTEKISLILKQITPKQIIKT